jgi:hypothetical protein
MILIAKNAQAVRKPEGYERLARTRLATGKRKSFDQLTRVGVQATKARTIASKYSTEVEGIA